VGVVLPTVGIGGALITVPGSGFVAATAVTLGGLQAAFTVDSDTSLRATVPAGAVGGTVSVTTAVGDSASSDSFRVMPTVASISPSAAAPGATVTLTGTGLAGAIAVSFGGASVMPT